MRTLLIAALLLLTAPLLAQDYGGAFTPGIIETPHIQLGSGNQPSVITVPPVVVEEPNGQQYPTPAYATPVNGDLLASRHFDFVVSPEKKIVYGSMEDTSLSLGDYARQLRAERAHNPSPNAMANPAGCN